MNNQTLGEKIRKYRLRSGKSQLQLELEIGASTGSISRIENNQINPTKETLSKIAQNLKLKASEVADLLDINIYSPESLINAINLMSKSLDLETTLQTIVDIMFDLFPYYNGGLLLLLDKEDNNLWIKSVSNLKNIHLAFKLMRRRLNQYSYDLVRDKDSSVVQTFLTGKVFQSDSLYELGKGPETKAVINGVASILGFKYGISLPLTYNDERIGVAVFTKSLDQQFNEEEVGILTLLCEQIAIIIKRVELIINISTANEISDS